MKDNYLNLTEEQKDLVTLFRKILDKELTPIIAECDRDACYPMEVHQKLFDAGLYALNIPKKYGGYGADMETQCILGEEIARYDGGFSFSFMGGAGVFDMFDLYGTEEQKEFVANKCLNEGAYAGVGFTEPDAGSDSANIRTTYRKVGDEYVINGTKCFMTHGNFSDFVMVAATRDRSLGHKGISVFLVERKDGIQTGKKEDKMGLRLSQTTELVFEDVVIPAKNLIGEEGRGFYQFMKFMDRCRPTQMCYGVGIAQAALDYAVNYAKQRVQFGKPIIKLQGVNFMLAEMQAKVHAARSMVIRSAQLADQGVPIGNLGPSTKYYASEICKEVCDMAIQVLGGYGYMREYPVEKFYRDIRIFPIFEGTNQIQKVVIAADLDKNG